MPDATDVLAVPFPLPEDAVVDYPALGLELAARIEALIRGSRTLRSITRGTSTSTSASSFAAAGALMPSDQLLHADGVTSYLLRFHAPAWYQSGAGSNNVLEASLDGVSCGRLAFATLSTAYSVCHGELVITPPAGDHYVNVRLWVGGGTGSILAGAGPDNYGPMIFTIEELPLPGAASRPAPDYGGDEVELNPDPADPPLPPA